ncbi:MFS family permease [Rhodococcus opacus]|nr:MFS transporter [Rhodococcus opacus]MDH6291314.1 MFS family permease [Rhodococcus opacus]
MATTLPAMIGARLIQGIGGGVLPLAFGIIRDEFPAGKVSGAVGTRTALTAVGSGLGVVLAGPLVETLGYRWLFWLPLVMVAISGVAAQFLVPESPVRASGRVNWFNAILLSAWLVALLLAVSQVPVWGWASVPVLMLFVVAAAVAAAWVVFEAKSSDPLIDMRMMRLRGVWSANLVALLMGVGMYAAVGFVPQLCRRRSQQVSDSGRLLPNPASCCYR